jgi:hypothetical protein
MLIESIRFYNVNTSAIKKLNGKFTKKISVSLMSHLKQDYCIDYINLDKFPNLEEIVIYSEKECNNFPTEEYIRKEMKKRPKIQRMVFNDIEIHRREYFGKGLNVLDTLIRVKR